MSIRTATNPVLATLIAVLLAAVPAAHAVPGAAPLVRKGLSEAAGAGLSKGASMALRHGLREGAGEALEKVAREAGEEVALRAARLARVAGDDILAPVAANPRAMVAALESLPAAMLPDAGRALARNAGTLPGLVARHGSGALEVAARHPGAGVAIAETLGDDGIRAAMVMSRGEAVRLARAARVLNELPAPDQAAFRGLLAKTPGKALDWIEKHPRTAALAAVTGGAVYTVDKTLRPDATTPDGMPSSPADRAMEKAVSAVREPLNTVAGGVARGIPVGIGTICGIAAVATLSLVVWPAVRRFRGRKTVKGA